MHVQRYASDELQWHGGLMLRKWKLRVVDREVSMSVTKPSEKFEGKVRK